MKVNAFSPFVSILNFSSVVEFPIEAFKRIPDVNYVGSHCSSHRRNGADAMLRRKSYLLMVEKTFAERQRLSTKSDIFL